MSPLPPIGALVHVSSGDSRDPWEHVGWFLGAHVDEDEDGATIYGVLPLDERGTENAWQGHAMVELSYGRMSAALLAGIELRPDDAFRAFAATYMRGASLAETKT